jgi:hypothetical protein
LRPGAQPRPATARRQVYDINSLWNAGRGSAGEEPLPPEWIYVDPAEAAAIEALADQRELSISELVTVAIDHWYGEGMRSA